MSIKNICLTLIVLFPLSTTAYADGVKSQPHELPTDVSQFITKRDQCDHFRGEEAYDEARQKFLEQKFEETCTGSDKALIDLRTKYKNDAHVTERLSEYEDQIE